MKCSDGHQSRLNAGAKGRILFHKKQDNIVGQMMNHFLMFYIMMLFTDGKTCVANKDQKFGVMMEYLSSSDYMLYTVVHVILFSNHN